MAYSYIRYEGDGVQTDFAFDFPYFHTSHIHVLTLGTEVEYQWMNAQTIKLLEAPAAGIPIYIFRNTPKDFPPVDFSDGSVLLEKDLDTMARYNLYIIQEAIDRAEVGMHIDERGWWDAKNLRIINVANPVEDKDAANKKYVDEYLGELGDDIQIVADNMEDIHWVKEVYTIGPNPPAQADLGDLWFDTNTDIMKVYAHAGWKAAGSGINGAAQRAVQTLSAGQTLIAGLNYEDTYVDVYLNGNKLNPLTDYVAIGGNSITLTEPAHAGDIADIISFSVFTLIPQGEQGIQGEVGPMGPEGPMGPAGPQGADSTVVGPKGDQGLQGPAGSQGLQGEAGPEGPAGPKGDKGDAGADGTSVVIQGTVATEADLPATATQGDAYIIGTDLWVWNLETWTNVGPIKGPKGDVGPAGPEGPPGPKGDKGEPGQGSAGVGGALIDVEAPATPEEGQTWYEADSGRMYIWYVSPATGNGAWVAIGQVDAGGAPGKDGKDGADGADGVSPDLTPYALTADVDSKDAATLAAALAADALVFDATNSRYDLDAPLMVNSYLSATGNTVGQTALVAGPSSGTNFKILPTGKASQNGATQETIILQSMLDAAISGIALTPGPAGADGAVGPEGPAGPQGEPGTPADSSRLDALEARCAALEAALANKADLGADVAFNSVTAVGDITAFLGQ